MTAWKNMRKMGTGRGKAKRWALPAAIVALAAFLRLHDLGGESLWADEALSISFASREIPDLLAATVGQDGTPPLYYLLLHFWVQLFGDSEFSLRLPSALCGVGTVVVTFLLGRLLLGTAAGIIASLLLAVSPLHLDYSQETRAYELLAFASALSFFFFAKLLRGERKAAWGYVPSTLLMLHAHHFGLFCAAAQGVVAAGLVAAGRASWRRWAWPFALVAAGYLPGLAVLYGQLIAPVARANLGWIQEPSVADLPLYGAVHAGGYEMAGVFLLLAALGTLALIGDKTRRADAATLWVWMLFPVLVPFVLTKLTSPVLSPRYTIAVSVPLFLLAAGGVVVLAGCLPVRLRSAAAGVMTILLCLPVLPALIDRYAEDQKPPWREVAGDLEAQARPGDLVVVEPGWEFATLGHYRETEERFKYGPTGDEGGGRKELAEALRGRDRVWLVSAHEDAGEAPEVLAGSEFERSQGERYGFKSWVSWPGEDEASLKLMLWEREERRRGDAD